MLSTLSKKIIDGYRLKRGDDFKILVNSNTEELICAANELRKHFCGNKIDLCSIISGKSGGCSEDCKYCSQSAFNHTNVKVSSFIDKEMILKDCKAKANIGINWYSIVTSGKTLNYSDFKKALETYTYLHKNCSINLCASHGLLSYEQFLKLKECGVKRIHENIETSENFFSKICTTHSFKDKLQTIKNAKKAGLEVCCGGIIGMGETIEDRIDMALCLSELKVNSIPINALIPVKGTPLQNQKVLSDEEIIRSIAIIRFINPESEIRLAAGRNTMKKNGKMAFLSGANAAIVGDMLTASGNKIQDDKKMFKDLENY